MPRLLVALGLCLLMVLPGLTLVPAHPSLHAPERALARSASPSASAAASGAPTAAPSELGGTSASVP
ncbi:MAG: hypothetical protein L3J72_04605, partial [Thermoplasmata archaeon]|nr:hypothetical protein [Thermoplasmata archaeon]